MYFTQSFPSRALVGNRMSRVLFPVAYAVVIWHCHWAGWRYRPESSSCVMPLCRQAEGHDVSCVWGPATCTCSPPPDRR
jgi:hypothetical protein